MSTHKIFLNQDEFEWILGEDLSRVIGLLGNAGKSLCLCCKGECCVVIGCELYSEKFGTCPILEIRPRECRFHFCQRVLNEASLNPEDRAVFEKPISDLLRNDEEGRESELFPLFPQFPLDGDGLAILGIGDAVRSIMWDFKSGQIGETLATDKLKAICLATGK
ncbi:MAG: hypothetical protein SVY53_13950 [Chloroflexota bacterium]|nr:hypothetical protein [Chloroflexota bacterium]